MLEEIKDLLVEAANVDRNKIEESSSLKDDLGIDSLDAVEIVLEIETRFDIKVSDEEIAKLNTVKDIIDLVESKK